MSAVCLQFAIDVDRKTTFLGGLDAEVDGDFAYMWEDDLMQVIFHGKYCSVGICLFACQFHNTCNTLYYTAIHIYVKL